MFALKCLVVLVAAFAAHGFNLQDTDVHFHVFSRENSEESEPLLPSQNSIITSLYFKTERDTVMTVHSNDDTVGGNFNAFTVRAHLAASDVNLVSVDWSTGAEMYSNALGNAPQVGEIIALFINILDEVFSYSPSRIKIVGVGLGAHIAGIAARKANRNIPHIVAIDPSFHGWTHHPDRLSADDADIVEVLHVTAGILGYDFPLGDIDFYANGGSYQTGCGADSDCSFIYGYAFYAESLNSEVEGGQKFIGTACESYEQAIAQQCAGARNAHFGGSDSKIGASGIYWFATNMSPPFARG